MTNELNNERGSATLVEMCFIFPIVIMVVLTMLYLGLYSLQSAVANSYAQRAAIYVGRMVTMPAYDSFGELSNSVDFGYDEGQTPDAVQVNEAVSKHDPYRFWNISNVVDSNKVDAAESILENLLANAGFLFGNVSCDIQTKNYFIYQTVTVNITQSLSTPFFVRFLGLPASIELATTVQAGANCPAEFARNVDLVYDVLNDVTQGKMSTYIEKLNSVKGKLGL